MAIRTVRLDSEAEATLSEVREATGLPISEVLKRGLRTLRAQVRDQPRQTPYDIYSRLQLGAGRYAIAPSTKIRQGVRRALEKKLNKRRR